MVGGARTLINRGKADQIARCQFAVKVVKHKPHPQAENGIILLSAYPARNGPSKQKDARGVSA